jgi:5-methyltetrahydropteroyltriglutamate--homocysteine methyltransferase
VSSKKAQLETAANIKARIDEASRIVPLDRLALSPQCGFASTEEGNALSAAEQQKKLELVASVADDVWG